MRNILDKHNENCRRSAKKIIKTVMILIMMTLVMIM